MRGGWTTRSLSEVIVRSGTIDPRKEPDKKFRYVDVSSISRTKLEIIESTEMLGKDAPSRARRLIQSGDVLFATVRPTLKRVAVVPDPLDGEVCSTGYFVFRTKPEVDNRYLFYFLLSDEFMGAMERLQSGASYPAVNDTQVKQQEITYPSLEEQKRIVAILDEAFSGIDTAIANTEKNLTNARELFESYLNSVFTNKGKDWRESALEEHIKFIDYRGKTPKKTESGLRLITAKNVRMGYLQREPEEFVSPDTYESWMTRGIPKKGDVLFTTEAPLGLVCQLDTDEKVVFAQRIITMQAEREVIEPAYLSLALRSALLQSRIHEKGTGATAKGIKASLLKKITIPLPVPSEQKMIVEKLQSLQVETNRLEVIYQQKLKSLTELKQSLLQKAFSGELTAEGEKLMDEAVA